MKFRSYGQRDSAPAPTGDRGWIGVNMRIDPALLPEGIAAEAINMRFRNGVAETRRGTAKLPWMNKVVAPDVFPWGTVYGTGEFRDPNTRLEYFIVAADGNVYYVLPNNVPVQLALPAGLTVTEPVVFTQCFNVLLIRGETFPTLQMSSVVDGFTYPVQTASGDGTLPIPDSLRSVFVANRLFVVAGNDRILASDVLDYTRYTEFNDLTINQGAEDDLVQISLFGKSTIIALKELSVFRVDNVYGNLAAATLSRVTGRYGCVAPLTAVDVGVDFLWLSQEGIASLTLTSQGEVQAGQGAFAGKPKMFSEDIQPLIDRINGRYASSAVAAYWDNKYYIALPIDDAIVFGPELIGSDITYTGSLEYVVGGLTAGATYRWVKGVGEDEIENGATTITNSGDFVAEGTSVTIVSSSDFGGGDVTASLKRIYKGVNNAVAVYDFLNAAWAGYDQADNFDVKEWRIFTYNKRRRLFAVTSAGFVFLYEEDFEDSLPQPYVDVTVTAAPANGDTIEVNGGDTVTADTSVPTNSGTDWGVNGGLATAADTIWIDAFGASGYNQNGSTPWSAPNTLPVRIEDGIRFYSTNGVLPEVTVTGDWATVTPVRTLDIPTTFVSRGYGMPTQDKGVASRVNVDLQTWNPTIGISVVSPGVNETEALLTTGTRSRTAYFFPYSAGPFTETNVNGDFLDAGREDYSIAGSTAGIFPTGGLRGDLHQESRETRDTNGATRPARSKQIRVTNTQGRVRIMGLTVEFTPSTHGSGASA